MSNYKSINNRMTKPLVVQGTVVQEPQSSYSASFNDNPPSYEPTSTFNGEKGEIQSKKFNDVGFAFAFIAHLVVMGYLLIAGIFIGDNGAAAGNGFSGIIYCVFVCSIFAVGLSTLSLGLMMKFATELIKIALFFSIGCYLMVGMVGLMSGNILMGCLGLASFAMGCCYAYCVWSRIPFAAVNLNTALTAVEANMGLAVAAYAVLALAVVWIIWWSLATGNSLNNYGSGVMFIMFISYFWTHQVLQNTLHCTTAGVIGTWWFAPEEASSFCSPALRDSFTRAITYSFGSICFGSLLVAIVQALRHMNHILRDNEDFNFLTCMIDCILGCIESIIEYLNKWAYVYVGLYGYSYLEAGKNVMTLFQTRGYSAIVTDNLVQNVLLMISVGIGIITGFIGWTVTLLDKDLFADFDGNPGTVGFITGLFVGFLLASILMGVIESAVNTIIVCFTESPAEFERNHPMLSMEMRGAWRIAYPDECGNL